MKMKEFLIMESNLNNFLKLEKYDESLYQVNNHHINEYIINQFSVFSNKIDQDLLKKSVFSGSALFYMFMNYFYDYKIDLFDLNLKEKVDVINDDKYDIDIFILSEYKENTLLNISPKKEKRIKYLKENLFYLPLEIDFVRVKGNYPFMKDSTHNVNDYYYISLYNRPILLDVEYIENGKINIVKVENESIKGDIKNIIKYFDINNNQLLFNFSDNKLYLHKNFIDFLIKRELKITMIDRILKTLFRYSKKYNQMIQYFEDNFIKRQYCETYFRKYLTKFIENMEKIIRNPYNFYQYDRSYSYDDFITNRSKMYEKIDKILFSFNSNNNSVKSNSENKFDYILKEIIYKYFFVKKTIYIDFNENMKKEVINITLMDKKIENI